MNGCLANKAWPHGAITVGEVVLKPSLVAATTKGSFCMDGWTATSQRTYMQVQPASFIVLVVVYTLRKLRVLSNFYVSLFLSAGEAAHGI